MEMGNKDVKEVEVPDLFVLKQNITHTSFPLSSG